MAKIFLSHSTDDKPVARRLARRIKEAGHDVWLDEKRLLVGDSLIDDLGASIKDADFLGVALSPSSVASPWVRQELNAALAEQIEESRVKVLPILVRRCEIPPLLRDRLYADISAPARFNNGVDMVVARLDYHDKHMGASPRGKAALDTFTHWPDAHEGQGNAQDLRSFINASLRLAAMRGIMIDNVFDLAGTDEFDEDVSSALAQTRAALIQVDDVRSAVKGLGEAFFAQHFDVYYKFVANLERRAAILESLDAVHDKPAPEATIVQWAHELQELTEECHGLTRELALASLERDEIPS